MNPNLVLGGRGDNDMNTYEIAAMALVVVVSLVLYAVFRPWHRCGQHDPLCRRGRPCLSCYRELFRETMDK
jgi:hypothetical protein